MTIAIAANTFQKQAFENKATSSEVNIVWVASSQELYLQIEVDVLVDCLFDVSTMGSTRKPLLINACNCSLTNMNATGAVARFCGWNGFIERSLWEIAVPENSDTAWLDDVRLKTGWMFEIIRDEPGFIAPRVISMIVNEAFFALQENVSTRAEIDTAMKLGTNYPFGPFEWAEKIGLANIYSLLTILASSDERYQPCEEMTKFID